MPTQTQNPTQIPRLTIKVTYFLSHTHVVGQNLSKHAIMTPTKYRGWLRSFLSHVAVKKQLMPLPLKVEMSRSDYVYRYLTSSKTTVPEKLLARMNIVGKYFGAAVVGYNQLQQTLGDKAVLFAELFMRSGLAVSKVTAKIVKCEAYNQGVRDDVSASTVTNPHTLTICELADNKIVAEFVTLPHVSDILTAPEEAWNGVLAGKPYVIGLKMLVEEAAKYINQADPWRLSPFPGRSKNPVEKVEMNIAEEKTEISIDEGNIQRLNREVQEMARRLAMSIKTSANAGRVRNGGRGGWYA